MRFELGYDDLFLIYKVKPDRSRSSLNVCGWGVGVGICFL